ncbi:GATOR2 complex protein WDR24 [Pocillopora verrucosa]|uniref:GATOR2 complex protein WDR24 n=1 Tax=Pocillopora verrucosa TaxID=203993 RepID=UPI00333F6E7D
MRGLGLRGNVHQFLFCKCHAMSFWELVEKPSVHEMAKTQEKGVGGGINNACTMHFNVDGALNSLSTSKDGSQVVVAGRNVFKVIGIEESGFVEKTNLRCGRINLNFSITDVQWHPVDDHILATAATNGAVVLWNLNKITRQKQELVFNDHKRTVNKIQFHPFEKDILLSGSQDGTMKYFDLRKQSVASTFAGKAESIRDVQFSPFDGQKFAAACENGHVQLWDTRMPNSPSNHYMGHNGPTFAIDWHPEEKTWVASAGRDKMVKVWEVCGKEHLMHTIQTIASVARIKWRPQRKYQIASCSLLVDFDIHVWDIRRPYIPYASFGEHKDAVTGILWRQTLRNKDPFVFLSCAKDSMLYQHVFSDAQHPAEHAPRVGLSINVNGDISVASMKQTRPRGGNNNTHNIIASHRKFQDMADNVSKVESTLLVHQSSKSTKEDWFRILAQSYQLSGWSYSELCEHNYTVASKLMMHEHAQTWSVLKTLYGMTGGSGTSSAALGSNPKSPLAAVSHGSGGGQSTTGNPEPLSVGVSTQSNIQTSSANHKSSAEPTVTQNVIPASETQDDNKDLSSTSSENENAKLMNFEGQEFTFNDFDHDELQFHYDGPITLADAPQEWKLASEAFEPRAALDDRPTFPTMDQETDRPDSPTSNIESEATSATNPKSLIDSSLENQGSVSPSNKTLSLPEWDFTPLVVEMLHHFADEGDVQMCVSALIVLGEKIRNNIDEQTQEQWLLAYIDLLGRLQLWSVANQIIKLSSLPAVSTLNQESTTVYTSCGRCSKPLTKSGWYCERCRSLVFSCSVCHLMVKGLNVWCQGCGHGGHLTHMQEWFEKYIWCPAGCGHMCEYT